MGEQSHETKATDTIYRPRPPGMKLFSERALSRYIYFVEGRNTLIENFFGRDYDLGRL